MGSLPPTKDRELKWWGQKIFKNTQEVAPGRFISMPPAEADYAQWKISEKLKEDILNVSSIFYGNQVAKWKFEKHRICWYVATLGKGLISSNSLTLAKGRIHNQL
jgi:hypothetical protein